MIEKLKNPVVISSIISAILLVLSTLGIINITNETMNIIVNAILSILTVLGIVNGSTSNIILDDEDNSGQKNIEENNNSSG